MNGEAKLGLAGRLARPFLSSKLTPIVVLASILLGVVAVSLTPREEEPQIVVPMVDVLVPFPGASPREVESQLTTPLERRLWGIPGVEYLYSQSLPGASFITVRIEPEPDRLRALSLSVGELVQALQGAQAQLPAGALVDAGRRVELEAQGFARSASELRRVVLAVRDGRPLYVEDVARVSDGPEPEPAVILMAEKGRPGFEQASTIVVAKRPGTNATELAERVLEKLTALRGRLLPDSVETTVTRNYGETAGEKSNELIEHLLIATLSVIALILAVMGWRSAVVVAIAVPVTLALTLLLTYLYGYTLNRVTLFALIFSIGILVDDAIVV